LKRVDLEHVLRAASAITNEREFIVIGSQAILGQFPDAPAELLVSDEVDIYPRHRPDLADLIDASRVWSPPVCRCPGARRGELRGAPAALRSRRAPRLIAPIRK